MTFIDKTGNDNGIIEEFRRKQVSQEYVIHGHYLVTSYRYVRAKKFKIIIKIITKL